MTGRKITERVIVEGKLILETPTHLGNGESEALTDMPLLRDAAELNGAPLICGTSIAGALRAYLRDYEHGYGKEEPKQHNLDRAQELFGVVRDSETETFSAQSWLMIDDALGETPGVELRDGVSLDPATRTALDGQKYDTELLQAGTTFPLSFELLLSEENDDTRLLQSLALALRGLEKGEIGLGMRKNRGLGQCRVTAWQVRRYRMAQHRELVAWLEDDRSQMQSGTDITALLGVSLDGIQDERRRFTLEGDFDLTSSLLIRSNTGDPEDPDMIHLRSSRTGVDAKVPVLSGTSLGGALRARALRIAKTVLPEADGADLIDKMFGPHAVSNDADGPEDETLIDPRFGSRLKPDNADAEAKNLKLTGSRVRTYESCITGGRQDLVQQRVKIDRFTGGAYPQALFAQQPLFGGTDAQVHVRVELHNPSKAEIGLLLLVLKDLWTGDLPLGGEQSVGRGRLAGQRATLTLTEPAQTQTWELIQQEDGTLHFTGDGKRETLEDYVTALPAYRRK